MSAEQGCGCAQRLRDEAAAALAAYEKAKADPRMRVHAKQLQRRWVAYGWAAGVLRKAQREGNG